MTAPCGQHRNSTVRLFLFFLWEKRQKEEEKWLSPARHSNVRRSKGKAVFWLSVFAPPPLPLHPLHHLPAGIIRLLCAYILLSQWHAQQSPIVHPGTSPLCFAYVQFGGGDWPIWSKWMPVQMSLAEVNGILRKAWIMHEPHPHRCMA